jgi:hypothetical protein
MLWSVVCTCAQVRGWTRRLDVEVSKTVRELNAGRRKDVLHNSFIETRDPHDKMRPLLSPRSHRRPSQPEHPAEGPTEPVERAAHTSRPHATRAAEPPHPDQPIKSTDLTTGLIWQSVYCLPKDGWMAVALATVGPTRRGPARLRSRPPGFASGGLCGYGGTVRRGFCDGSSVSDRRNWCRLLGA